MLVFTRVRWFRVAFQVLLILVVSSCAQPAGEVQVTRESLPGASACGDGVCDALESANPVLCPRDCAPAATVGQQSSTAGPQESETTGEARFARIVSHIEIDRQAGQGSCGISPWMLPDCQTPRYWWGGHLAAEVEALALLIEKDGGDWMISNQQDVLAGNGINPTDFPASEGRYTRSSIDFADEANRCAGQMAGQPFDLQVAGDYAGDRIHLLMTSSPTEKVTGQCGGEGFQRMEWNLRSGWAAALSGDPHDLIAVLSPKDKTKDIGGYRREYSVQTNPSADNRDSVRVVLTFECLSGDAVQAFNPATCPWE